MKKKKSFNTVRSEKIANLYLSSIDDIMVKPVTSNLLGDFIVQPIKDASTKILIEVKAYKEATGIRESKTLEKRLLENEIPSVIMYIDSINEKGYFKVVSPDNSAKLHSLTGSTISTHIHKLLKK